MYKNAFFLIVFFISISYNHAQNNSSYDDLEKGIVSFNNKNYTDAISCFNKAILKDNGKAEAYYYLGLIYNLNMNQDSKRKAFENYNSAIKFGFTNSDIYMHRGFLFEYIANDDNSALNDYNRALKIDSTNSGAYINLALILEKIYSDSIDSIAGHIILTYPDSIVPDYLLNVPPHIYERSIYYFSKAIQFDSDNVIAYWDRANARKAIGDKIGACGDVKRAIQIDAKDSYKLYLDNFCN